MIYIIRSRYDPTTLIIACQDRTTAEEWIRGALGSYPDLLYYQIVCVNWIEALNSHEE